jgi:hypothetical protein
MYWQVTSTAKVPGIATPTDVSYFNPAALAAASPAPASDAPGSSAGLQVRSVNAAAGQALTYTAAGLPPGTSISPATGQVTGTLPAAPGAYQGTVTVTGPAATTQTVPFTWLVHGPGRLTWPGRQATFAGARVDLRVQATDGLAGCSLTFTATGLPIPANGGTFLVNPATGLCLSSGPQSGLTPLTLAWRAAGQPGLAWHLG